MSIKYEQVACQHIHLEYCINKLHNDIDKVHVNVFVLFSTLSGRRCLLINDDINFHYQPQ